MFRKGKSIKIASDSRVPKESTTFANFSKRFIVEGFYNFEIRGSSISPDWDSVQKDGKDALIV